METITRGAKLSNELCRPLLRLLCQAGVDGPQNHPSRRFLALPSVAEARLLVPLHNRRCAVGALGAYCPHTLRSQLLKAGMLGLLRLGWHGGAGRRFELPFHPQGALPQLIEEVLGESSPAFALIIGSPGALRKCVLQVMRSDGQVLAYVKVPLTDAAAASLRHEAFVIADLAAFESMRASVPQVLYAGECDGSHILIEKPGPTAPAPARFGPAHEEFLSRLAALHPVVRPGEAVAQEIATCFDAGASRMDRTLRGLAQRAMHVATDRLRGNTVACGLSHGDFAPWNMRRRNLLYVFDWERASYSTPVVWDKFHFYVQSACLLRRRIKPDVTSSAISDPLFTLYLVSSICNITAEQADSRVEIEYRARLLHQQLEMQEAKARNAIVAPLAQPRRAAVGAAAGGTNPSFEATVAPSESPRLTSVFSRKRGIKLLSWARQSLFALTDQALTSGANFLMGILLARYLGTEQYGQYALAYTLFLLFSLLHQAIVLEPLSVFGASEYKQNFRKYGSALLRLHLVVVPVAALSLVIVAMFVRSRAPGLSAALVGTACAAPCILLLWFARRLMYTLANPFRAAIGAALYCVVLFAALEVVLRRGLDVFAAFVIMGIAALAGSLPLLLWFMRCRSTGPAANLGHILREHWTYGKWTVASSFLMWLPWNAYYTLLTTFHGPAEAGTLKALLNLAQVVFQMYGAMSLLLLPHAAATSAKRGVTGSEVLGRRVMWVFAVGSVLYWLVVSGFRQEVLQVLYRGSYTEVSPLIPWIGVACVLWGAAQGPGIALRGANSPRTVFWAYLGASGVTLLVGIPASWAFGIKGATAAMVLSSATALGISARLLRRQSLRSTAAAVEATAA